MFIKTIVESAAVLGAGLAAPCALALILWAAFGAGSLFLCVVLGPIAGGAGFLAALLRLQDRRRAA